MPKSVATALTCLINYEINLEFETSNAEKKNIYRTRIARHDPRHRPPRTKCSDCQPKNKLTHLLH
ncbi:hypothetical protein PUN28_020103 [Cardiocondyla obscurior]|uniref:Ribosomal protein L33 n=1 Tax=Cardiocondyla obscurior TaxID=286306 RepID=A0AAW2EAH9_9HYME